MNDNLNNNLTEDNGEIRADNVGGEVEIEVAAPEVEAVEADTAAVETEEAADANPPKSKKGLIITLASVGGALLIGAIVLCLWLFVFRADPFKEVAAMYEVSQPSKIVAITTQIFGVETDGEGKVLFEGHKLKGEHTLIVGEVDGKAAAVYKSVQDRLGSVEEGGGQDIREPIFTDTVIKEYIEGTGLRTTENGKKGKWDSEGGSIIPERGAIALNISRKIADGATYENNKLSFTVRAEDTEELLGQGNGVKTDVKVEIITDGVFVIGINLSYGIPGDEENNVSESTVSISVVYTYDFEQISID